MRRHQCLALNSQRSFMAVFTPVSHDDARQLLKAYRLGELVELRGIAAGIENSNFFLSENGNYFTVLPKKRSDGNFFTILYRETGNRTLKTFLIYLFLAR